VAVSVREWPAAKEFPRELAKLCDHLRRTHGLEILFLLMQPEVDRAATERVRQYMEEPSFLLDVPCTPQEMMAVLGRAKLCLAMRLHTLIFAARMAVPALGLIYDPKVESFLAELELPSAGRVEEFRAEAAAQAADALLADYDTVLESLRDKSAHLHDAAEENEVLLLKLLGETKP
jgi:polysaccharide pyruvyl transferase WcaK-like protein